jgi:hypothetical protein
MMRPQHYVETFRTADEIESRDTAADPLKFHSLHDTNAGDFVLVGSRDGAIFLGKISDTDDNFGYVELS